MVGDGNNEMGREKVWSKGKIGIKTMTRTGRGWNRAREWGTWATEVRDMKTRIGNLMKDGNEETGREKHGT